MYYDAMIFIQQYKVYEMAFLLGHGFGYRSACVLTNCAPKLAHACIHIVDAVNQSSESCTHMQLGCTCCAVLEWHMHVHWHAV